MGTFRRELGFDPCRGMIGLTREKPRRTDDALRNRWNTALTRSIRLGRPVHIGLERNMSGGTRDPAIPARFEVMRQLGSGGMGAVYYAFDSVLERRVAIKCLKELIVEDKERIARFKREAMTASALNHPNIVTIYDLIESNSRLLIVMELIRGDTLERVMCRQNLELPEILLIAVQVSRGLEAVHRARIIHRDIKPANIMVGWDRVVKIVDFGIAVLQTHASPETDDTTVPLRLTAPHILVGTPSYMSPEQIRRETIDARSDMFSFGSVLYEMLTGTRPFLGESAGEVLQSVLDTDPAPPSRRNPQCSRKLDDLVMRCLAKRREDRPASMADVQGELERLQQADSDGRIPLPIRTLREYLFLDRRRIDCYLRQILVPGREDDPAWDPDAGEATRDAIRSQASYEEKMLVLYRELSKRGVISRERPRGMDPYPRPGLRWPVFEGTLFFETIVANRVVVPPTSDRKLAGVTLWIAWWDESGTERIRRQPGPLYLIEDYRHADERADMYSGYSALELLVNQLHRREFVGTFERPYRQLFARAPLELLGNLGAVAGAERRVDVLYRLRATASDPDAEETYAVQTVGYPIAVGEWAHS